MTRDSPISRRTALKITGGAAATALVAGCNGNGENGEENGDDEEDGYEIEPGTTIELDAQTAGWEGLEPAEIEDDVNPTLILQEGEEYEIGWPVGDGGNHNIEIWNEDDEVVDGLQTEETTDDEPDDQFLEFTASEEMDAYVCAPHDVAMNGDLIIE
ncbi:twin-arginine translocation signal domain-containing protein [Natronobacterium gregoryi]|nr:twin-arginine translocation signal domain-containing protein [Natronobacterium gregoryi]ELY69903.1 blue (type 1) copper domain-containing protein [Natronobacterium gregoryi SP2]PLK21931.1 hypothetical protein CYV19_01630 [Natronobacterium gregoryi SP2]